MKLNFKSNLPEIILGLAILSLAYFAWRSIDEFSRYDGVINAVFTLVFVYLTYKTLLHTIHSEVLPYIKVKFILASKIDDAFISKYPILATKDNVRNLINDFQRADPPNKNLVFILVENIEEKTAVEVTVDVKFTHTAYDRPEGRDTKVKCGTLNKGEKHIELIDTFDQPAEGNSFEIKSVKTNFNTSSGKNFDEPAKKVDSMSDSTSEVYGENITILFKTNK